MENRSKADVAFSVFLWLLKSLGVFSLFLAIFSMLARDFIGVLWYLGWGSLMFWAGLKPEKAFPWRKKNEF